MEIMTNRENKYKYIILLLLFLGWSIGNLSRFAINFAIIDIGKDFGLNASSTGIIISSFFVGYALSQLPGGWLADKFGAKKVLIASVILWSLFGALSGMAWSMTSMIVFRFMLGFCVGIFWPTTSKAVAQVFPTNQQGKSMAILLVAGAIIAAISSVLFVWIIGLLGWRALFFIVGGVGIIVIVAYLLFLKIPSVVQGRSETVDENNKVSPLKQIIKVPMLWAMLFSGFCVSMITWGINAWIPTFLVKVRYLSLMEAGKTQVIPLALGAVAMLVCGVVIDRLKTTSIRIAGIVLCIITAISIYLMYTTPVLKMFLAFEGVAIASVTAVYVIITNLVMRQFPPEVTGSAVGFMNFGAQCGSFMAPTIIGLMVDANQGSFTMAFTFLALVAVIAAISFLVTFVGGKKSSEEKVQASV